MRRLRDDEYGDSMDPNHNFSYQSSGLSESSPFRGHESETRKSPKKKRASPQNNSDLSSRIGSMPSYSSQGGGNQRIGSIKSNYFEEQKRRIQAEQNQEEMWIMKVIKQMLSYIFSGFSKTEGQDGEVVGSTGKGVEDDFKVPELFLSEKKKRIIEKFREFVTIPYDRSNPYHEKRLSELWRVCFPDKKLTERYSPNWKILGFQNKDPATDFRAAGIFGLETILFFSRRYPTFFAETVEFCRQNSTAYPFILAVLNCFLVLMNLLGWTHKKSRNLMAKKRAVDLLFSKDVDFARKREKYSTHSTFVWGSGSGGGSTTSRPKKKEKMRKKKKKRARRPDSPEVIVGTILDFGDGPSGGSVEFHKMPSRIENETDFPELPDGENLNDDSEEDYEEDDVIEVEEEEEEGVLALRELVCALFYLIDTKWKELHATYFMFNEVMEKTTKEFEGLLENKFYSLEDVEIFNRKAMGK